MYVGYAWDMTYVCVSEDNLQELILVFHRVSPRTELRLSGLVAVTFRPSYWSQYLLRALKSLSKWVFPVWKLDQPGPSAGHPLVPAPHWE